MKIPIMLAHGFSAWMLTLPCGLIITLILAIVALFPAARGDRRWTFILTTPAFGFAALITLWFVVCAIADATRRNGPPLTAGIFWLWAILAGLPFVVGAIGLLVLWRARARTKAGDGAQRSAGGDGGLADS
jgi:hypothetical protein